MDILTFNQITENDIRVAVRSELASFFSTNQTIPNQNIADEIGGIELAVEITGKAKATIYNYCSNNLVPHSKRGKKLYFSRNELTEWIKTGRRKTQAEAALAAKNLSNPKQSKLSVAA